MKYWTLTFGQKLDHSHRMLPSRGRAFSSYYMRRPFPFGEMFPSSWVERYGRTGWKARPPDLIPEEIFLWAFVKDKVYWNSVSNILQYEGRVSTEIKTMSQKILNNVSIYLESRFHAVSRE